MLTVGAWPRLPATTCQTTQQETAASTTAAPAADRHSSTLGIPTAGVGHIKKEHMMKMLVKVKRPGRLPHPGHSPLAAAPSQVGRFSTGDSRHLPLYIKYCRNTTDVGI